MPVKRCPKRYCKGLPQRLQNQLWRHQYSYVAVGEGIVERILSRNTITVLLEDNTETEIRLFKINNNNEPYYWEAEQVLQQILASQKVYFVCFGKEPPNTLLADVYLPTGQSATETLLKYGLVSLQQSLNLSSKHLRYLVQIESKARAAKRGIWGLNHKKPSIEKLYVNQVLLKPLECMVHKVDNIDSIQMTVIADNFCITVTISASLKLHYNTKKLNMVVRKHLLNKKVIVELQDYDICANRFTGRIIQPQLVGLSKPLPRNRRINKTNQIQRPTFVATVVEVFNGNTFTLRVRNGVIKNVFLSYIKFPCEFGDMKHLCCKKIQNLKLVSVYYTDRRRMQAREFLRKLLVGNSVQVTVDYLDNCEGVYCTIIAFEINVARVLIEEGYAVPDVAGSACPYRQTAQNQAEEYDSFLHPWQLNVNVAWCMDNVLLLLNILKKKQIVNVVVEQVLSPSYIILYSVQLHWLFAFSLIDFEEVRRSNTGFSNNNWKEMVTGMIAEMCLQKQVSLRATSVDCNGVFHGNLILGNKNLKTLLLRRTTMHQRLHLRWHRKPALPVLRRRKRVLISTNDSAQIRRIKQHLRRDVKILASLPFSFSPSSQHFVSNRKKKMRVTVQYHFERQHSKIMTIKLPSTQETKQKKKRGKKKKKSKPKKEIQNKKYEQVKDNMVQDMIAAAKLQQSNVLKKKKKSKQHWGNSVTLRWCCF